MYHTLYFSHNKDIFAKKNLAFPKTFAEMIDTAQALTDPKSQTYGFVARGQKNANTPVWTSFMLGYDMPSVDASGKLMTDTPEAIEAAKLYQTLLTKASPTGVRMGHASGGCAMRLSSRSTHREAMRAVPSRCCARSPRPPRNCAATPARCANASAPRSAGCSA